MGCCGWREDDDKPVWPTPAPRRITSTPIGVGGDPAPSEAPAEAVPPASARTGER